MPGRATKTLWYGAACLSIILVSGCGPNLGAATQVSGTVTVDDQPLANAPLAFHALGSVPAEHRTFTTMADAGGQYKIEKIYPGEYQVIVVEPSEGAGGERVAAESSLGPADGNPLQVRIEAEPAVYDIKLARRKK